MPRPIARTIPARDHRSGGTEASARRLRAAAVCVLGFCVLGPFALPGPSSAQGAPPGGTALAQSAARRFPQPVRVGDLLNRAVLQPVESQAVLGTVQAVVRNASGTLMVVVELGRLPGFGRRPVAIPVDAMTLLGDAMQVVAFTPAQLRDFPTFGAGDAVPLATDAQIKVGLARPAH